MPAHEIKIPWVMSDSWQLSQLQKVSASNFFRDTGVLIYDSEHNRYFVDSQKVPWWQWFPMEIRFQHLLKAWPFIHGSVLELGCQAKPFRLLFERLSDHYWGFEFLNHVNNNLSDVVARQEYLPLRPQSLETIVGVDVLRRVNDPAAFLRQIYSALKSDGNLILWVSHGSSLLLDEEVYFDFSPKSLRNLVESAGLQIEHESTLVGKGAVFLQNGIKFISSTNYLNTQKSIFSRLFLSAQKFYLKHWEQKYYKTTHKNNGPNFALFNGFKLSTLIVCRKL